MKKYVVLTALILSFGCAKNKEVKYTPEELEKAKTESAQLIMDVIDTNRLGLLSEFIDERHNELKNALEKLTKLAKEHEKCIINANKRIKALMKYGGIKDPVKVEPDHHQ